ncbi:DUF6299 family protein [Streptomyces venezuelae]|uniref:DUF6299 family protein n=1 Tax=Streptomyces venezuelae TaxID=54571 RepID=UPI00278C0ACF|nr:DUF6299 family protein [Streptomyces venezuelae]
MRVRLLIAAGVLLAASAVAPLAHAGGAAGAPALPTDGHARGGFPTDGHPTDGDSLDGFAADGLSVHGYGTVGADATVTLSGMYRCLDDSAGPVFVSSNLVQGNRSAGIGGTRAVCDGHLHEWVNTSVVKDPAYRPGAATVRATLMQLTSDATGLPTPRFLASEEAAVELR